MTVLPLLHSTRCEIISLISKNDTLSARPCTVYGEDLLYCFYGRPAYQSRRGNGYADTEITNCPVCFVIKTKEVQNRLSRSFPFDTGAGKNGHLNPPIDPKTVDEYDLGRDMGNIVRFVHSWFGDTESYVLGTPLRVNRTPLDTPLLVAYYTLISQIGQTLSDERKMTVEMQFGTSFNLLDGLLHAVILPSRLLDRDGVKAKIRHQWRAVPISYPTFGASCPTQYSAVIRQKYFENYQGWV